jgi:hypothetical protein
VNASELKILGSDSSNILISWLSEDLYLFNPFLFERRLADKDTAFARLSDAYAAELSLAESTFSSNFSW